MLHDPALIAAFNADADTRMVWATERSDRSQVVYLEDGTAREMRARTKAELACIVPECDLPLTTHARTTKRDGFVHLRHPDDALHSAESLMHQQAKAVVVAWLRTKYPHVRIDPEVVLVNGERRPDVYAENPATGNRLAFEVQYSPLTVEQWDRRHEWYADHGIVDVWLFGHVGNQRRRGANVNCDVVTNALQQHILQVGELLWWIEPTACVIATPYVTGYEHDLGSYNASPHPGERELLFDLSVLNDAWLTARGFRTESLVEMDKLTDRVAAARERAQQRVLVHEAEARAALAAAVRERLEAARREQQQAEVRAAVLAAEMEAQLKRSELEDRLWRAALKREMASAEAIAAALAASDLPAQVDSILGFHPDWLYVDYSEQVPETALGIAHQNWQAAAFLHVLRHSLARGPERSRPHLDLNDFIEGVKATGLCFERHLLEGLLIDWCGHLWEHRQLSARDADGRARLLTKVVPASELT